MKNSISQPLYSQIALDIASRIARDELKEKTKIYGRSVMSSEYGVSPETIRRSLKLLSDMEIVDVKHNSGAVVLSREKAIKYLERFNSRVDIHLYQKQLGGLLEEQTLLAKKIDESVRSLISINEKFSRTHPFQNYELEIPPTSPVIGLNIGELKFWQRTGATVIAIRRGDKIILSPGPYAVLHANDIIIFVGDLTAPEAARAFVESAEII